MVAQFINIFKDQFDPYIQDSTKNVNFQYGPWKIRTSNRNVMPEVV